MVVVVVVVVVVVDFGDLDEKKIGSADWTGRHSSPAPDASEGRAVRVGANLKHFIVAYRTFDGSSQGHRRNSDHRLARAVVGAVEGDGMVIFVGHDNNVGSWSWRHSSADGSWCLRRTSNLHWRAVG